MDNRNTLTPEEILKKRFTCAEVGYKPSEVDAFLDLIIQDYQMMVLKDKQSVQKLDDFKRKTDEMATLLDDLGKENRSLLASKKQLEIDRASLKNRLDGIKPGDVPTAENMHLIQRVRALEDFLYSKGYNPNEIVSLFKK